MPLSFVALGRKVARGAFGLLLSPLDYLKELVFFAALIALASWLISSLPAEWPSGRAKSHAASGRQPSIARLITGPAESEILLFRDLQEIVGVDQNGQERFQHSVSAFEYFQFGRDRQSWSFIALERGRELLWWNSELGEIACDDGGCKPVIHDLSLAADGQSVALADRGQEVRVWRCADDGTATPFRWVADTQVDRISLSPKGNRVVLKSLDSEMYVADATTGTVQCRMEPLVVVPMVQTWSEDERWFAVAAQDHVIRIWRFDATADLERLAPPDYTIQGCGLALSLALSPDGRWLYFGTSTGEIHAWCDGKPAWSRQAHPTAIRALDLSDDGRLLFSGCNHGRLLVHATDSGDLLRDIRHDGREPR